MSGLMMVVEPGADFCDCCAMAEKGTEECCVNRHCNNTQGGKRNGDEANIWCRVITARIRSSTDHYQQLCIAIMMIYGY